MSEPATNPETVADRLTDAGVMVRTLDFTDHDDSSGWAEAYSTAGRYIIEKTTSSHSAWCGGKVIKRGTRAECIAACNAHHAAAVLANLEVVPSEEQ